MNKEQLYAKFFDLEYSNKKDDVDFYYKLAQEIDGPILECACGTGRILVPIARSGKEIWGFDSNINMLDIALQKIGNLNTISKTNIFHDDLTTFSSSILRDKKFKFIFLSFDSYAYLAQKEDGYYSTEQIYKRQYIALKKISEHLDDDGVFAFDLFSPTDLSKDYFMRHHFSKVIDNKTWNLFSTIHIPTEHIFQIHYFMEILDNDGTPKRWYHPVSGYQTSYKEILSMLKKVGLHPEKIYEDFNLKLYKRNSEQMIFICKKR